MSKNEEVLIGRVDRCDSIYEAENNFKNLSIDLSHVVGRSDITGCIVEIRIRPEGYAESPKPSRGNIDGAGI